MAQENLYNETEIRRFLLGEMPADARIAFEIKFTSDESLFEQISIAEDELIESYLRETLSSADKKNFEREFLSTESLRQRVAFMRTMLDKINKEQEIAAAKKTETAMAAHPSVWDSIANFFKTPKLALGAALAIIVLIFGGWFLMRNGHQTEFVKQITPTPTAEIIEPNPNQNAAINENNSVNANTNAAANTSRQQNRLAELESSNDEHESNHEQAEKNCRRSHADSRFICGRRSFRRQNARIEFAENRFGGKSAIKSRKRGLQNLFD